MITLTAKLSLLDGQLGVISSASINNGKSNVSSQIGAVIGSKKQGGKPFIIGTNKIGDNRTYEKSVPYYIGNVSCNSNNVFDTPYVITVNGNNIVSLTINFDNVNNQYPTSIIIDGTVYQVNSASITINNLQVLDTHIITINNWNTANYPLTILGLYIDIEILINNKNMTNVERTIIDRSDIKLPSWGIITNGGDIEFNDLGGVIKYYIEQQILEDNIITNIAINNTSITNKKEQLGAFNASKWEYNNSNSIVKVELKDNLLEWQNILLDGMPLQNEMTMLQICDYLKSKTPNKWTFKELDGETQSILQNTICKYPYLESGSLWNEWNKLCEVCALYVYKNNQDNIVISYEFRSN